MNTKRFQHLFFSTLLVLSVFSFIYLNLHVEPSNTSLVELAEQNQESAVQLMADIDAFKRILQNVSKQIIFQ